MNLIALLAMAAADLNGQPLPDVVLLDFTAGYCQPCQQMAPLLQRMESDGFPIRKIDITEQPSVSRQYRVDRIPTLIILVEGQEAKRFVGLRAESELRREMNDAARKLDMKRRAAGAPPAETVQVAATEPPQPQPAAQSEDKPGLLTRMRDGLFGKAAHDPMERPDFRGQSPDDAAGVSANDSGPMNATVRVRLDDGKFRDVGTGTIIHSTTGQSTILTCAHIFKDVDGKASVIVDVFRNGEVVQYPASVVGGDHNSDISIIQIRNKTVLPVVSLAQHLALPKSAVFSIGCNGGRPPTIVNTSVVELNRYEGPENVVCSIDPVQGRSGGGLFNADGELMGVCSGAFRQSREGLYTGVGAVRKLLGQLGLNSLFEETRSPFGTEPDSHEMIAGESPNPFAAAEENFATLFDEDTAETEDDLFADASPFGAESPAAPAFSASPASGPPQSAMPDSLTPEPRMTGASGPEEITVIIGSNNSAEKRVVVIPKPSPWLMELLTGEPTGDQPDLANMRSSEVSTTSARRSAQTRHLR